MDKEHSRLYIILKTIFHHNKIWTPFFRKYSLDFQIFIKISKSFLTYMKLKCMYSENNSQRMQGQDTQLITVEGQLVNVDKELWNENSSSRIWSQITSSRVKQAKEVIEIVEQKSLNPFKPTRQPKLQLGSEKPADTSQSIKTEQSHNISQNPTIHEGDKVTKEKDQLVNRQLYLSHSYFFEYLQQKRLNQEIEAKMIQDLFKDRDQKDQTFRKVQIDAVDLLMKSISTKEQNGFEYNLIRLVDLLHKKYILKPWRDLQNKHNKESVTYDIYKPNLVFAQASYSLKVENNNSQLSSDSLSSNINSFKRNAPGKAYDDNEVLLIQDSTTEPNDDLEAIANNYVNSVRKQKYGQQNYGKMHQKNNSGVRQMKRPFQTNINVDSIQFRNQIKMPNNLGNKQFHPGFSVFQCHDDQKSQRFNQQRMIAKTFVKDGYGLSIVRNYMGPSIQGGGYNRAITTIIRQSYKKIQQFLSKQCNIKIHNLTSSQFSLVKTPLVHCRNILRPDDLRTFFKFIAVTYNFGKLKENDYPTAQETLSLYNSILRGLNDRKSTKESLQKPSYSKQMYMRR